MTKARLEKIKFDILKKKAHAMDVDPTGDYMKPGSSPSERAFVVASCSLDLLIHLSQTAFPAAGRRTRRRGAKYLMQSLLYQGADGMLLLAHAQPLVMAQMDGRFSAEQPSETVLGADYHHEVYKHVESFYPLPTEDSKFATECRAEFQVMQTHEPRAAVAEGSQAANEYSQALLRGENPDDDPELVRMQREYARDYLIDHATHAAAMKALPYDDVKILVDKMTRFPNLDKPKAVAKMRARLFAAWSEGLKPYLEYAVIDSQSARPKAAEPVQPS